MIFIFFLFWASSSEDALFHYLLLSVLDAFLLTQIELLYGDLTLKLLLADL